MAKHEVISEINIKTIKDNIKTLRKRIGKNVKICAVVKANAYSFGDQVISPAIERDIDCFGVAHLKEAKRLRDAGIIKDILLFGICSNYTQALKLNIVVSINSVAEIRDFIKTKTANNRPKICHVKVNTGLNRYGIKNLWQLRKIIELAVENNIDIRGLYTHFSHEEDNLEMVDKQLEKFKPFRKLYKKYFPHGMIHAAAAGTAHYPPAQFDMVRVGKNLYGGYPGYKTALTVRAKIVAIQNIRKGEVVGYAGVFIAPHNMRVGVVNSGYADFVHFGLSNKGVVLVDNRECKILGRICMDAFIIDVTHIENPLSCEVTLIGDKSPVTIMDIVKTSATVTCDLLCGFNYDRSCVSYKTK